MKNKKLICAIIIAVGIIGVVGFIILGSAGKKGKTPDAPTQTPDAGVNVQNPTPTEHHGNTQLPTATAEPTPFDPEDPVGNGDIAPDEIPDENNDVFVNAGESEAGEKDTPFAPTVTPKSNTEQGQKKQDETMPAEVENEIINDNELEQREESKKKQAEEDEIKDKPTTIVNTDTTIGEGEDKPVSVIDENDEYEDGVQENGNGPTFVDPAQGGSNPFENGGESEIDDRSSDEFIGEDGDRPGEGIHF